MPTRVFSWSGVAELLSMSMGLALAARDLREEITASACIGGGLARSARLTGSAGLSRIGGGSRLLRKDWQGEDYQGK
ncbi:MAG: hypothetical protein OEV53_13925 [Nitrospira sp.]|nr:hypothetical protein [Nitrospira sp.]